MVRRPAPSEIPDTPGVYLFRDTHGEVLYVGKAKTLRKRIPNYFAADLPLKTKAMTSAAESIEWDCHPERGGRHHARILVVQEHQPRFNIRLRDDKSFPYLAITADEEWPRAMVMLASAARASSIRALRTRLFDQATLDLLLRTFPVRTCSDAKYRRHEAAGRPCLLAHIEKCSAPCVAAVDAETYAEHVEGLAGFLAGDTTAIVDRLEPTWGWHPMRRNTNKRRAAGPSHRGSPRDGASRARYRSAGRLRCDRPGARRARGGACGLAREARPGHGTKDDRCRSRRRSDDAGARRDPARSLYGSEPPPRSVLVQEMPEDGELWQAWLVERREGPVSLRVPMRGSNAGSWRPRSTMPKRSFGVTA